MYVRVVHFLVWSIFLPYKCLLNIKKGVGEGEGGTNGESNIETYILPYVKQVASGNLLDD